MGFSRGPNIVTDGLVFGYDADDRSTRFYPGEPTTNLATSVIPTWDAWGGMTGISTSYISASGRMGVKLTTFTSGGVQWWVDSGGRIRTVSPNTTYTISAKIRFSGGNPHQNLFYIRQYNSSDAQITEGGWYYSANNVSIGDGWYRTYRTFTTTSTTVSLYLQGYEYNTGISIEIEDIQFEQKSYPTQFVNGTRGVTGSLIDLKRSTLIDVSNVSFDSSAHPIWVASDTNCMYAELGYTKPTKITIETVFSPTLLGGWQCVMHRSDAASVGSAEYWIGLNGTSSYITGTIGAKTGVTNTHSAGMTDVIPALNKYYHVVSSWDGINVRTYVNGELKKTYALSTYSLATDPTIRFGAAKDNGNTYAFTGKIPIGKVYWNKSFGEQEVLQNYNSYKLRFNL